jgi:ABC-type tungstate transport system permease subunit
MKEKTTKVKPRKPGGDEMRAEYDFSKAVRGKYYKRVMANSNVVVLDPDVAENFKNSKVVNEALRNLLHVTDATVRLTARSSGRGKKRSAV